MLILTSKYYWKTRFVLTLVNSPKKKVHEAHRAQGTKTRGM